MPKSKPSNILLYGKGVFTTIAFCDGEPFLWEKHWRRLTANATKVMIDISHHSETAVRDAVDKAITEFGGESGRLRVSFLDESPTDRWGGEGGRGASLFILSGVTREPLPQIGVAASPYLVNSTSPLAGVKSCNYLEPLMALEEVKTRGFGEAIRLNERGQVASACMANVFWLKGGRLSTPSLKTGCLAGTTREYVLEKLECEEIEAGIDVIQQADEIFLTSAGIGVVRVAEFNGRKLRHSNHPIIGILPF